MKKIILIAAILLVSLCGTAQSKGSLNVRQDSRVDNLLDKQRKLYAIDSTLNGFRVQIFMEVGNDAIDHAKTTKQEFERAFRGIPVYLSYGQPYYRLRVGDFRNRVEAEKCLREIRGRFSNAFVTADNINPPKMSRHESLEPQSATVTDDDADDSAAR